MFIKEEIKKLNKKIENNSEEIKKLKIDNVNLNIREKALEEGFKKISEDFECPISAEIIKSPVITPDGFTYEEEEIKNWIRKNGNEPITLKPLAENQLIKNHKLKSAIESLLNYRKK